ncbi:MAG: hypothetical protein LBQ36_06890 [Synergistaceae bacterium]|nr:hypothetical protein [Synergistaceae bacterium]
MGKKTIAAVAALILIAGVAYAVKSGVIAELLGGGEEVSKAIESAGEAIPGVSGEGGEYVFMSVSDTRTLSGATALLSAVLEADDGGRVSNLLGDGDLKRALAVLDSANSFVGMSSEMALFVSSADVPEVYLSLFADAGEFDRFVASGDSKFLRIDEWDAGEAAKGTDAWKLRYVGGASEDKDVFYMTRRTVGDKCLVNIAADEAGIGMMKSAAEDPAKRFSAPRATEGPNYALMRLKDNVLRGVSGDINEEMSWVASEDGMAVRSFSGSYASIAPRSPSDDFKPLPTPILGEGALAMLFTFDLGSLSQLLPQGYDDPFEKLFGTNSGLPADLAANLTAIAKSCRLSAVVVDKGGDIGTAYLVIETPERETVDKLYAMATLFLGEASGLEGWDSAYDIPLGPMLNAVLARRGDAVLLGVGEFADYGKSLAVSPDIEEMASPANVIGLALTSRLFEINGGELGQEFRQGMGQAFEDFGMPSSIRALLNLDEIEYFGARQNIDGKGAIDVIWRK